jgi:hypothetical protein
VMAAVMVLVMVNLGLNAVMNYLHRLLPQRPAEWQ